MTSLPEVSTGLASVRMGDYQLAFGDIFGGNAFLPVLFLLASLLSGEAVIPPSPHVARTPVPTLLRAGPYRLFMFMSDCVEPHHVHVEGNDGLAKFWMQPVSLAENVEYSPHELHRIRRVVESDRAFLITAIDTVCERAWR